jgi:two-component system sensor histidine kinase RegB
MAQRTTKTFGASLETKMSDADTTASLNIQAGAHGPEENVPPGFAEAVRPPRLRTLTALQWLAIIGQSVVVIVAWQWLDVDLPIFACALAIGASIIFNAAISLSPNLSRRLNEGSALSMLSFDLCQLAVLLFLTGGLSNPFALFLLGPVTITATVLSVRATVLIGALSLVTVTILSLYSLPLVLKSGAVLKPPPLLLAGFWVAITLGLMTQAIYARRIAREAFTMSVALAATQSSLDRERRLSAIGALSAAAAHELGTPLATIKLVAGELRTELQDDPDMQADAMLIQEQADRCSVILGQLRALKAPEQVHLTMAPALTVVAEAAGPHRARRSQVIFRFNGVHVDPDGAVDGQPQILRRPEVIHGLRNFIQNAVDFAAANVWVDIFDDEHTFTIRIGDDGAGFSDEIIDKVGEPFATTRGRGRERDKSGYLGMGLGVFIAKTLLERSGAAVTMANAPNSKTATPRKNADAPIGAIITVTWSRDLMVVERLGH